jgi:aryl-alcohol dehydrogenase-like predicted oxidoreductase
MVTPIGFGAFKIGRNTGIKYPRGYEIPGEAAVERLLGGVLELGINFIDTAPAYGSSEERIGRCLHARRGELVLSTKVGEAYAGGRSTYDLSPAAVRASVRESLRKLRTEVIDILLIHSPPDETAVLERSGAAETLQELRAQGAARAIGLSARTVGGAAAALDWADVIMVEYNLRDSSQAGVIADAAAAGVGVVVKKGLASGRLEPREAVSFVLSNPAVGSLVVGGLDLGHLREVVYAAADIVSSGRAT